MLLPRFFVIFSITTSLTVGLPAQSNEWPRLRGPSDNGSASMAGAPTKLDDAALAWKVTLPGKGCSTPIVVGRSVYLTVPVDGSDALQSYDLDGKLRWQMLFGAEEPGKHRNGSGSNPSPASDGKAVFAAYKSGAFAAVNTDGSVRWKTNLVERFGPVNLFWDFGSSPVLTEKNVVVARMHNGESWLAAFDKITGELRWKTARNYEVPREVDNGYTTPQVIQHGGKEALLSWGSDHLTIHSAADGKLLWSCTGFNPDSTPLWPAVASPVLVNDTAVVCFGRADKGAPRWFGIKVSGQGDVTSTAHLWKRDEVSSFVPSPAAYKGLVYILSDRGQVACIDPATGKAAWTSELPRASANFYASPVIVDGVMYAAREDGVVFVAKVEGGFELLSENKLDDRIIAALVPAGGRIFARGNGNLYCFKR
jgi:outer membrane protein assembly factor BamB